MYKKILILRFKKMRQCIVIMYDNHILVYTVPLFYEKIVKNPFYLVLCRSLYVTPYINITFRIKSI